MAKSDWNLFEFSTVSNFTQSISDIDTAPSEISPGGGEKALKLSIPSGWIGASPNPTFGYMYNGIDKPEFPLDEGHISYAIRTNDVQYEIAGLIIRSQVDLNGTISDPNNINYYMIGLTQSSTVTDGFGTFNIFKIINGVISAIGSPFVINANANKYCQLDVKLVNVSGQVEIYNRINNGTQITKPGSFSWSDFSQIAVDASPGVLINSGYWGFGIASRSTGSVLSTNDFWFDKIRITQEILGI